MYRLKLINFTLKVALLTKYENEKLLTEIEKRQEAYGPHRSAEEEFLNIFV